MGAHRIKVKKPIGGGPKTWWNGEPCTAHRVRVKVGKSPYPTWWCAGMVGTIRDAVRVEYGGVVFYLDDETGEGWAKVTEGKGSPQWGHKSIPSAEEVPE